MRAIRYHEHGDERVLSLDEVAVPKPQTDEALVRIHAVGVNPFDTYVREGLVQPPTLPHIGGADMAGVVESTGADVTTFADGDRVFATGLGLDRPGTYAEYVCVPENRLAPLPDGVSYAEGAAAAETFATAWRGLTERGDLSMDDVCLIQGASGGVGHAAVQIARRAGAFVVGTARSGDPAETVERLGADAVVDYREADLAAAVREATGGRGVDVVLETHADANLPADLQLAASGGRIVVLGEDGPITVPKSLAGLAKKREIDIRFMSHMAAIDDHGPRLERVGRLLADGTFEVIVAEAHPLAEAAEAQRRVTSSGIVGKIVVDATR